MGFRASFAGGWVEEFISLRENLFKRPLSRGVEGKLNARDALDEVGLQCDGPRLKRLKFERRHTCDGDKISR
jgi:hypothetical protein